MTLFVKSRDRLDIAYEIVGEGSTVVLIHGFASDRGQNWKAPGWYSVLTEAGHRVVALDCRGHGESDKPHDPSRYGDDEMANDVIEVMRAAGTERAHIMGYSMGGMIAIHVLMAHPDAVDKLIIGGVGANYLAEAARTENSAPDPRVRATADALVAGDKSKITDPTMRAFREFAEQAGKDRQALAACMLGARPNHAVPELSCAARPALVVCGENDSLSGPAGPLASAFVDGRAVTVPGRDHMMTVGDKVYKHAVLEFLAS